MSQECVYGNHGPMLSHCFKCKAYFSYEDGGCGCEPEYDEQDDPWSDESDYIKACGEQA